MSKFFSFFVIGLVLLSLSACITVNKESYSTPINGKFKTADGKTVKIEGYISVSTYEEESGFFKDGIQNFFAHLSVTTSYTITIDGEEIHENWFRERVGGNEYVAREDQDAFIRKLLEQKVDTIYETASKDIQTNTVGYGIYSIEQEINRIFNPAIADTLRAINNIQEDINNSGCTSMCFSS